MRRIAWPLAVLGCAFAAMCTPARAKPSLVHDATVATTPTDVIGVDNNSECTTATGDNGYRIAVSHDRGATVSAGVCVSGAGSVMLDPVDGAAYAFDKVSSRESNGDASLLLRRLDANGAIVGTRQIPLTYDAFEAAGRGAVNGGSVYVVRSGNSGQPLSMQRFDPSGRSAKCALPPDDFYELVPMPGGVLIALGKDQIEQRNSVSRDGCASWTKAPDQPGGRFDCTTVKFFSPVRAYLGCWFEGDPEPTAYALDFKNPTRWRRTSLAAVGYDYYDLGAVDVFVDPAETRIQIEADSYGHPGWPAGWSKPSVRPPMGARPPKGKAARALAYVNRRFRNPLGLPAIGWLPLAAKAAQNHADYFAKNGTYGHGEKRGKPGFTGKNASDRCDHVGLRSGCSEVASSYSNIVRAVQAWLGTPLHSGSLLHADSIGLGWSKGGSVGNATGRAQVAQTIRLDAPPNTPGSGLKAWPADGMKNVATEWTGNELPDPLASYEGDREDVGPTLFLATERAATLTLTRRGSRARIPLLRLGAARAKSALTLTSGFARVVPYFVARELKPRKAYVLKAKVDGKTHRFDFRTARRSSNIP